MIEISRTQDEEVGDGTTSVIILGKDVLWLQVITSVCFPRFCIIIGCYTLQQAVLTWAEVLKI